MSDENIKYVRLPSSHEACYVVGSDGSLYRVRQIRPGIGKQGRGYAVFLFYGPKGKPKYRTVHSVVAECFIGPRPQGMTINHKDGDKWNNSADNLEYMTQSENTKHAFRLGLRGTNHALLRKLARERIGKRASNRKFTDEQAAAMIAMYRKGRHSMKEIGVKHGCSASSVHRIVHGDIVYQYVPR